MLFFPFDFGILTPSLHPRFRSQAMAASIVESSPNSIMVQITVSFDTSMLDFETQLQRQLNEAGNLATAEQLRRFDTDGSPIQIGSTTLYSKGQLPKEYQTPYGAVSIERHVYQSAQGGTTFCPLERAARIVVTSTPLFAKIVSSKYAEFGSARVQRDLRDNHRRSVSKCLIQDLADAVAAVALAKEESWTYRLPRWDVPPATVSVGLDGSCTHLSEDGWRETMVGTLGFYDADGQRLHTIYLGATPEYGKATFLERLTREVERAKAELPDVRCVGIADGAKGNWEFLEHHTEVQVVDFWHAAEYLGAAATVLFQGQDPMRKSWLDEMCHILKHEPQGAERVIRDLRSKARVRPWAKTSAEVTDALRYFENQNAAGRMDYASRVAVNDPIGSGVTEAACKVIVKQRLCGSGMRWKEAGAAAVLSLRCLTYTPERWDQFWSKVDQDGFPSAHDLRIPSIK
jgi:hypothetical protein